MTSVCIQHILPAHMGSPWACHSSTQGSAAYSPGSEMPEACQCALLVCQLSVERCCGTGLVFFDLGLTQPATFQRLGVEFFILLLFQLLPFCYMWVSDTPFRVASVRMQSLLPLNCMHHSQVQMQIYLCACMLRTEMHPAAGGFALTAAHAAR